VHWVNEQTVVDSDSLVSVELSLPASSSLPSDSHFMLVFDYV